jgi:uncharacterized OB-fold protein
MTTSHAISVPLPDADDPITGPFWKGAQRGVLMLQRCAKCRVYRWIPRPACTRCWSMHTEWAAVSGRGRIHSWVRIHHAFTPAFAEMVPYQVAIVDLDEGVRILGNIDRSFASQLTIGQPVEARFQDMDGASLLYFVPTEARP